MKIISAKIKKSGKTKLTRMRNDEKACIFHFTEMEFHT
jgi:hypothetical protein